MKLIERSKVSSFINYKMHQGRLGRLGVFGTLPWSPVHSRLTFKLGLWPSVTGERLLRPFGITPRLGHPLPGEGPERLWTASTQGEWRSTVKQLRREVKNAETSQIQKELLEGSRKVVGLAILSNGVMFTGKLVAAIQSGSASLFSEALHSLADSMLPFIVLSTTFVVTHTLPPVFNEW